MAGFLFGATNLSDDVIEDIQTFFLDRTGEEPEIFQKGDLTLLSSGKVFDDGKLKIALDGYVLDVDGKPEEEIAKAYRRHGSGLAKAVNGSFRTIVYDSEKESITVTTDRAGRKVVYYSSLSDSFLCSSHLSPVLRHPQVEPELNPTAVADFLRSWSASFGGGERLVKNVSRLLPSYSLTIRDDDVSSEWYWDVSREKRNISDSEAVKKMDELFREGAEKIAEEAESPLNLMLSGGFDSTFLLALLREVSDKSIETYTWGWRDEHFEDGREMAERYGTSHNEIMQSFRFPSDEEMMFYEEPQNAFVRYPFYELYHDYGISSYWTGLNSQATFPVCLKNIRKIDKVSFAEQFLKKISSRKMKQLVESRIGYKYEKAFEVLESDYRSTAAVIDWGNSRKEAESVMSEKLEKERNIEAFLDRKWRLRQDSYQEVYSYLQLRSRDTARYAYYAQDFDHYDVYAYLPLLEFSYSLPMSQKKNRRLLQKIAEDRVPERIITKGASGWDFVSQQFRKTIKRNEQEYRQTVSNFIGRGLVNEKTAEKLLLPDRIPEERGKINQMIAVYLLERWIKLFLDRDEPWKPV